MEENNARDERGTLRGGGRAVLGAKKGGGGR